MTAPILQGATNYTVSSFSFPGPQGPYPTSIAVQQNATFGSNSRTGSGGTSTSPQFWFTAGFQALGYRFVNHGLTIPDITMGLTAGFNHHFPSASFTPNPTDVLLCDLYLDSSGSVGAHVAQAQFAMSSIPAVLYVSSAPGSFFLNNLPMNFRFATPVSVTPGSAYWFVVTTQSGIDYGTVWDAVYSFNNTPGTFAPAGDQSSFIGPSVASLSPVTVLNSTSTVVSAGLLQAAIGSDGIALQGGGASTSDGLGNDARSNLRAIPVAEDTLHPTYYGWGHYVDAVSPPGTVFTADPFNWTYDEANRVRYALGWTGVAGSGATVPIQFFRLPGTGGGGVLLASSAITPSAGKYLANTLQSAMALRTSDSTLFTVWQGSEIIATVKYRKIAMATLATATGTLSEHILHAGETSNYDLCQAVLDASGILHIFYRETTGTTGPLYHIAWDGTTLGARGTVSANVSANDPRPSNTSQQEGLIRWVNWLYGSGCAVTGGVVFPYIQHDNPGIWTTGCLKMAFYPSDLTTTAPALTVLPNPNGSDVSVINQPGALVVGGDGSLRYFLNTWAWGANDGIWAARQIAGQWTGAWQWYQNTQPITNEMGPMTGNYIPSVGQIGLAWTDADINDFSSSRQQNETGKFAYYTEPTGYPAFVGCTPTPKVRPFAALL